MKAIKGIMIFCIIVCMFTTSVFADSIGVNIDGQQIRFTNSTGYAFVNENGRTMVPLRVTMEAFGASVWWDGTNNTAYVQKDGVTVTATVGKNYITRNNQIINNDAQAAVLNGRTYLPIRAVLECFGAIVDWDSRSKSVVIDSQNSSGIVYGIEHAKASSNYWKDFSDGVALKAAYNFSGAISKFTSVAPAFINEGDSTNTALLFGHLGECYAKLGFFDEASSCWMREGYYWGIKGGTQEKIAAERKADYIKSEVKLYIKTTDESKSQMKYFGAPLEPEKGIILGAYAEGDTGIYDYTIEKFYMNTFPKLVGKDHSAYLLYYVYGTPLSQYQSHIEVAKEKGKIIELALQPINGLDSVTKDNGYLVKLAQDMEKSGCKFILRFANEMNDGTNPWYTTDYNKYIDKFRLVSNVFKEYAPSVAIMWSPNFYPSNNIANYYLGDEYVDYVGVSSYQVYSPALDPLKQGIDRGRWSNQLDFIYSLYGDRKPIIIAEGGASYAELKTGLDITSYSAKQLKDFYTYLPIKYPNVKGAFLFGANESESTRKFMLSSNSTVSNAYSQAIKSEYYLSDNEDSSKINMYYYEIANNKIGASVQELNSYVKYAVDSKIARVEYKLNGNVLGSTYDIPYNLTYDFSSYSGQNIEIIVNVYDENNALVLTRKFKTTVE